MTAGYSASIKDYTSISYGTDSISITAKNVKLITLGGYVWEDAVSGKESLADGQKGSNDKAIPNVKVTLYTSDGKIATLHTDSADEFRSSINPTYTDANGQYKFAGVDTRQKYYVTFEYNGQTYMPTDYLKSTGYSTVGKSAYNPGKANWTTTSKGTETLSDRNALDSKFAEIGSSPYGYKSSNSLNSGKLVNGYNEAFSQYELMGFVLDANGNYYKDESLALIDGFYTVSGGNIVETSTLQEGKISKAINAAIQNKQTPNLTSIYKSIAGSNTELWKKLQFIEDCKITSYTQNTSGTRNLYSVEGYDYDDEYYINQGLWRRQEFNLSLTKDVAYAATTINGKTEVYKYDKRGSGDYWEIQVRMQDYANYYGDYYTREIYPADYNYSSGETNNSGSDLEVYITYKITVKNTSQSVLGVVTEIVDYYDKDYTFMDNLSWIMYKGNGSNTEISMSETDYYNTIAASKLQGNIATNNKGKEESYGTSSKYGSATQQADMEKQYNSVYINGLQDKKLASGEEAYVYLTFKVNKNDKKVILDDDGTLKQNFAEINGYKTYYKDKTELPNGQTKGSGTTPGLIDINSTPGNLSTNDLKGEKYEKNFEDDTDRAKSIKVTVNDKLVRNINGYVWEDKRTAEASKDNDTAKIGNGVREDGENLINGVTVELREVVKNDKGGVQTDGNGNVVTKKVQTYNGSKFVSAETTTKINETTKDDGYYEFSGIIPGDYIVQFKYGDTDETALPETNGVSYNGQDFKSTVYQKDMNGNEIEEYKGTKIKDNAGNEYNGDYYDIQQADDFGSNISDAKDVWSRRVEVNNYCSNNGNGVTNSLAEILASPYTDISKFSEEQKAKWLTMIGEFEKETQMTAETGIIKLEGEYNTTISDGLSGNGNYVLKNVDFGLTERPKAQLELSKTVTHILITLPGQKDSLFDTSKATTNLTWVRNEDGQEGLITATMDEELMHGATIKISYKLTVKNIGEIDFTSTNDTYAKQYYYKGVASNCSVVTTTANVVLDYVANNLQYVQVENEDWSAVKPEDVIGTDITINTDGTTATNNTENLDVNSELESSVSKYNVKIKTTKFSTPLEPGGERSVNLVLQKIMSSDDNSNDRVYRNIAEITRISNSVGRRMEKSIQGNQDPTEDPAEKDSAKSEEVKVTKPYGVGNKVTYIAIAIAVAAILIVGIIFIKKKALKKE